MRVLTAAFIALVIALVAAATMSAQGANRATDVMATARKALGGKKVDEVKTLSVEAVVQRNVGSMQISSDVEILVELPDKYLRTDQPNSPGVMMAGMSTGFNGDKSLAPAVGTIGPGGGMVIRMGPTGPATDAPKPTPEEQARMEQMMVRNAKTDLSRLMLGWFATAHPGLNVEYAFAGEAESPDGRAFVIDAKNADGFAARLFVDMQSGLPLMVTYKAPQRQMVTSGGPRAVGGGNTIVQSNTQGRQLTDDERKKMQEDAQKQIEQLRNQPPVLVDYTIFFEDWRSVDGVRFPHKMRRAVGSDVTEEWTINKVRINPKIDAKKFAVKG
jgi:outer membrane lipoprotein-sorting protein